MVLIGWNAFYAAIITLFSIASMANGQQAFVMDNMTVAVTLRDFWGASLDHVCYQISDCGHAGLTNQFTCVNSNCHRDFETYNNGVQTGAILTTLDADGKPVLVSDGYAGSWSTVGEFAQWYRDIPGLNIPYSVNLTFSNSEKDPSLYSYFSTAFFPLTNMGYGNFYNNRNFHFTTELKARFIYNGGETFSFTGDDDLWVFINGKLVVDIGGVHGATTRDLNVDTLGLTKGTNYPFVIFHAERHTTASNFQAYTSLALYCPWYDHCGICQGTGQTCCTCNDNNPCTTDSCNVTTGACIYTPITCASDGNVCHLEYCDSTQPGTFSVATHCKYNNKNCNTGSKCTVPSCDPVIGCTNPPKDCSDTDPCTLDMCNEVVGCYHIKNNCSDVCTAGSCYNTQGQCLTDKVTCPVKDPCQIPSCDKVQGCIYTPYASTACNDGNACTTKSCTNNNGSPTCVSTPINCTDNSVCTLDTCDDKLGCQHTPISCDDKNPCTQDLCNPTTGCYHVPVAVTVPDLCTTAYCDPVIGIVTSPITCRPTTSCGCQPTRGCVCDGDAGLSTPAKIVVLSAGAIAGIAIGAVAGAAALAFVSKKGFDVYRRHRSNMQGAQTNPMYQDNGRSGVNPFHTGDA